MTTPKKTTRKPRRRPDIADTRYECPRCGRLHRGNELSPGALSATCINCHKARKPKPEVQP